MPKLVFRVDVDTSSFKSSEQRLNRLRKRWFVSKVKTLVLTIG